MKFKKYITDTVRHESFTINEYDRTRKFILLEAMSAQGITNLVTGSFLAGYLKFMGASESLSAVLMQLPLISCVAYLYAPLIYEKTKKRLRLMALFHFIYRLLIACLSLPSILFIDKGKKLVAFAIIIILSYFFSYLGDGEWIEFLSSCVPARLRGKFLPKRDAIMIFAGTTISLIMGGVLDLFRSKGLENIGFYVIFGFVFAFTLFNGWTFTKMTQPPVIVSRRKISLKDVLTKPIMDKQYRKYIIFFIIYNISVYLSLSLYSIYPIVNLGLSYAYMATLTLIATVSRIISARFWHKLSERLQWPIVLMIAVIILGFSFLLWSIVNIKNAYIILPVVNVISGIGWGGVTVGLIANNVLFAPIESRTIYFSFNAWIGALTGFISSLFGAFLNKSLSAVNLTIGGLTFVNMQLLFLLSGFLMMFTALYIYFCLYRQTGNTR